MKFRKSKDLNFFMKSKAFLKDSYDEIVDIAAIISLIFSDSTRMYI